MKKSAPLILTCLLLAHETSWAVSYSSQKESTTTNSSKKNSSVSIETDFLYWKVNQNGNEFAQTGQAITTPGISGATSVNPGHIYRPHYTMQPGFKFSVGYLSSYDNWDLRFGYMWIESRGRRQVQSSDLNSGIIPIFSTACTNSSLAQASYNGGTDSFVSSAYASSNLYLNAFDLELGKTWMQTNKLKLRPFFGLKGTYQHQNLKLKYNTSSSSDITISTGSNLTTHKERLSGIGIKLGVNTSWMFSKYFGVFADAAGSLLWTSSNISTKNYDSETTPNSYNNVLLTNQSYHSNPMVPVLELFLGFGYEQSFTSSLKKISFKAGWEEQIWLFLTRHSSTIADDSLAMQGLTLKFALDF